MAFCTNPAWLVHAPDAVVPAVFATKLCGAVHVTGSLTVSDPSVVAMTADVYQPFVPSVPSSRIAATGLVLSIFTVSGAASVLAPAWFVHEPATETPLVSLVSDWGSVQVTGPLISSAPVVVTSTLLVYQPLAPIVPDVTERAAAGPVLSILIVIGVAAVVSPASLVQLPLMTIPVVSVVIVWSFVQMTGPLIESAPFVATVTFEVNQPFRPAVPFAESVAVGPVLSILIVTESEELPPALCAEHDEDAAAVSLVKSCGAHPESMTTVDSGSVTDHPTVTFEMYQPFAPSVPAMVFVMTGPELSGGDTTLIW